MLPAPSMLELWLVFHSLHWSLAQCDASKITVPIYKALQYTRSLPHILAHGILSNMTSDTSQSRYWKHWWKGLACLRWRLRTGSSHSSCTTHSGWGHCAVDPSSSGDYRGSTLPGKEKLPGRSLCWRLCRFTHLISDTDSEVVKRKLIWKTALTLVWAPSDLALLPATLVMDIWVVWMYMELAVRANFGRACLISAVNPWSFSIFIWLIYILNCKPSIMIWHSYHINFRGSWRETFKTIWSYRITLLISHSYPTQTNQTLFCHWSKMDTLPGVFAIACCCLIVDTRTTFEKFA